MAEPRFAGDDDLPRTFRREREAREREARERAAPQAAMVGDFGQAADYGPAAPAAPDPLYAMPAFDGTVKRFDVPFGHLVGFFLKCVLASIPALLLLTLLLFAGGKVLQAFAPQFRLFEIVIKSPDTAAPAQVPPLAPTKAPPAKK